MNKHGGYQGDDLIDFSVNVNHIAKSEYVRDAYIKAYEEISHYPEIAQKSLVSLLSQYYNIEEQRIIVGNGVTELMFLLARTLSITSIGIFEPTYTEYRRAFELAGIKVITILDTLKEADAYLLCNPNNPTGEYKRDLTELFSTGKIVILDESFIDFVDQPVLFSYDHLIRLHSLTKYFGLAGLRLGYLEANENLIQKMYYGKEPWSVNIVSQRVFESLVHDSAFHHKTKSWLQHERQRFLSNIPSLRGGAANFFFLESKIPLFTTLQEKGFYVRSCEDFIGVEPNSIRFCMRGEQDNKKLIAALKELL